MTRGTRFEYWFLPVVLTEVPLFLDANVVIIQLSSVQNERRYGHVSGILTVIMDRSTLSAVGYVKCLV
jgi:hypothetical protein